MTNNIEIPATSQVSQTTVSKRCRQFSALCKIAFIIYLLWNALSLLLMCWSMLSVELSSTSLLLGISDCVVFIIYSADACLVPLIASRMLDDLAIVRTPFTLTNSKRFWFLGILMVAYAVLCLFLDIVDSQFLLQLGDASVQVGGLVSDFASNGATTLDLFPLVIAAVFFALSYVFKYGVLLQQESDETL